MTHEYINYEDTIRETHNAGEKHNLYSKYRDLIYYESSLQKGLMLAMIVEKPAKPSYILASTHGWHMSIPKFVPLDNAPVGDYLKVSVDMRGRAFSDGTPDCNGYELYDVYDAVEYVKGHYKEYILEQDVVYFESGSGGGGNCYEILCKFPDYFAAATALCGMSDYAEWYRDDTAGDFRDELSVWIAPDPDRYPMEYRSRSGIDGIANLYTPLFIAHGETDVRVPVHHARDYVKKATVSGKSELVKYLELKGVGTMSHWGNATEEQMETVRRLSEENRLCHRVPVEIPDKGTLTVHGYIVTKKFSVFLDGTDKCATLCYDINAGKFEIECDVPCRYRVLLK